jgi:hypothetical protein
LYQKKYAASQREKEGCFTLVKASASQRERGVFHVNENVNPSGR